MAQTMQAMNRQQVEEQVRDTFGFVPAFYRGLPDAGLGAAWSLQRDLQLPQTALDNKTKELIGLAMAAQIKCKYCIHFHTQAARAFGASDEEMREAILMGGLTVLFSNNLTGTEQDLEQFRRDVDRAIDHLKQEAQGAQV